jgi:hypothetical protein
VGIGYGSGAMAEKVAKDTSLEWLERQSGWNRLRRSLLWRWHHKKIAALVFIGLFFGLFFGFILGLWLSS